MFSPQLEDGFTRIANELLDALCSFHLSPNEWQIILCIIRKTYGFGKKDDIISLSQFQKMTGIKSSNIPRIIKSLELKKIIVVERGYYHCRYYLYKYYQQWAQSTISSESIDTISSDTNKRNNTKENKRNTVTDVTQVILINNEITTMEELEYIPEHLAGKKSKYGNKVMAMLVRTFAESASIEIKGTFDASPWSKPLSAVYQYFDKDADMAIAFIRRASSYFEENGMSFTPHTLHKNLPMIDKWIKEKEDKQFSHINNNPLYE